MGTTWVMPKNIHEGKEYHVAYPTPKHVENSFRGIEHAAANQFDSIDLDMLKTLDHVIINAHWPRLMLHDGYIDPTGKLSPTQTRVETTHWVDLQRLHTKDGYVLDTMARRMQECAEHKIVCVGEAKGNNWTINDMLQLWNEAHIAQCPTIIKSAWTRPLDMAKHVGFQTRYTRDHKIGM